ncbi:SH3 domain-containing protein [Helicobacter himalayensis]|uniref:SH3 domain-containing protein n=1 Tax=Helicobacter himalayensis TaxID=1591088 RepID=UPI003D6F35B1
MKNFILHFFRFFLCSLVFGSMLGTQALAEQASTEGAQDLADSEQVRAKIAYLKVLQFPQESLYIGQEVSVSYEATFYAGASFVGANFDKVAQDRIEILNKNAQWRAIGQDRYQVTYHFKIKNEYSSIPPLSVRALSADSSYEEVASVGAIPLKALNLKTNPRYIGIFGEDFKILRHKSKIYDDTNNIVIFEFQVKSPNVRDMSFPNAPNQGFEELRMGEEKVGAIYYVVVPKSLRELNFEYFNLRASRFESVSIPIVVSADSVSTQSDLKPKVSYTLFKFVFLGLGVALFFGLFLWKRSKLALFAMAILIGVSVYNLTLSSFQGVLKKGAQVSILPMNKSTIVRIIESDMQVEVLDSRKVNIDGENVVFYKVLIGDSQIGWVRSVYVVKN